MAQQRQSMGQLEWDSSNKKSALRCHMSNCLCSNQGERITLITRVIRVLAASVINIRVICCLSFEAILCLCFCLGFELRSPSPLLELRSPRLFCDYSATILRLFCNYSATILRLFCDYSETILRLFCDYSEIILRLYIYIYIYS